ncbi:hypothetical protein H6761_01830 [Candidatus Nomurabacteria bacterium]|nr:hypothetical protein [Candidatus Nomurabacteria bacterium]
MGFERQGDHLNPERSEEQDLANEIANQRIGDATRMMANLNELRAKGVELSPEGKEGLGLLKSQIEKYLGE